MNPNPSAYQFFATKQSDSERLATALAALLAPGCVVALDGDLGAGKTTFSAMIAKRLGIEETVNSPTFQIIKEYLGARFPLYHMDVYRLDSAQADALGLDDYFYGDGVTLIEWACLIAPLLPEAFIRLTIEHGTAEADTESRRFRIEPYGEPYVTWCKTWSAQGLLETNEWG